MIVLTGVLYPILVTLIAQVAFPHQANGSIVSDGQNAIGSKLLAQGFTKDIYFWPRASAVNYDALASGGSNLGPTSAVLKSRNEDCLKNKDKTVELCLASGSGLDPDISPLAASGQIERVANARHLVAAQKEDLSKQVQKSITQRQWGVFGEERVNVLLLNRAVDALFPQK